LRRPFSVNQFRSVPSPVRDLGFPFRAGHGNIAGESDVYDSRGARPMTIAAILEGKPREIVSVEAGTIVRDAVALLAGKRIGALPVLDCERIVGIVSERDVIYRLAGDGAAVLDWPVSRVMTTPAITIESNVSALAALSQMTRRRVRHLPVVDGETLIGFVSIGDLVAWRISRIEQEAEAMRAYIQSA
jgi:CBS domain-containing protein